MSVAWLETPRRSSPWGGADGQEPGAQPEADCDRHTSKKKRKLEELHTPTVSESKNGDCSSR